LPSCWSGADTEPAISHLTPCFATIIRH
jgi:hypothetical protein